jgi:hypothetical protein
MKRLMAICFISCLSLFSLAQTVAINTDGTAANTSAMLDVKSTSKGMLVPRMTASQRIAIVTPANGLLVYDTDSSAFSYFDGAMWNFLKGNNNINGQWDLKGNGGTTAANFIGTTDAQPLRFRVNNMNAGIIDSVGATTALGFRALHYNTGQQNTSIGTKSLFNNSTGGYNTSIGAGALFSNTTGSYNTVNGNIALYYNTTGNYNTANGYTALFQNTTGYSNTADGASALNYNTTGYSNTASGANALFANTTGYNNTAAGQAALYLNTTGVGNVASGRGVLNANTTGSYNTANGFFALATNETGNYNTALGDEADVTSSNLYNATAIGFNAKVSESSTVVLGGTAATAANVAIGATAANAYGHGGTNRIVEVQNDATGANIQSHLILSSRGNSGSMGGITWASPTITAAEKRTGFIGNVYAPGSTNASPSASMPFYTVNAGSLSEKMRITNAGNVGIGTSTPNAPLQFANDIRNRKIVLWESANNDYQFYGFGINGGTLRYEVGDVGDNHVFYAGVNPTTSNELMRIKGNGNVGIGSTNPSEKLEISGKIKIVDGSQGVGRVLTSDANGVGTWVTNTAITPAVFGSFGAGVALDNTGNFYTTANITLPPGKWIVNATYLMTPNFLTPLSAGQGVWVRTYFTDGAAIATGTTNIIAGSSSLISGSLNFPSLYGTVNGQVMINNNTGGNKTYYVWASMELMGTTSSIFKLDSFNGIWGENQLTAIPMN